MNISFIIAETAEIPDKLNIGDMLILGSCVAGVVILSKWVVDFDGFSTLAKRPVRRNRMELIIPFLLIVLWAVACIVAIGMIKLFSDRLTNWKQEILVYVVTGVADILIISCIVFIGWSRFARRLKGFGLDWSTAWKDLKAAVVNLIAISPLVILSLLLVDWMGQQFGGSEFEMQVNESIQIAVVYTQLPLRVVVFVSSVFLVPIFEEMLFRGMLQSMISSLLNKPWIAILITSVLFASLHPGTHWPAIMILSGCMGYAYEKSGSLIRAIFIHVLFNGISMSGALLG